MCFPRLFCYACNCHTSTLAVRSRDFHLVWFWPAWGYPDILCVVTVTATINLGLKLWNCLSRSGHNSPGLLEREWWTIAALISSMLWKKKWQRALKRSSFAAVLFFGFKSQDCSHCSHLLWVSVVHQDGSRSPVPPLHLWLSAALVRIRNNTPSLMTLLELQGLAVPEDGDVTNVMLKPHGCWRTKQVQGFRSGTIRSRKILWNASTKANALLGFEGDLKQFFTRQRELVKRRERFSTQEFDDLVCWCFSKAWWERTFRGQLLEANSAWSVDIYCFWNNKNQVFGSRTFLHCRQMWLHPSGGFRGFWNSVVALLVLYDLLLIPMTAFDVPRNDFMRTMDVGMPVFWCLDFVLTFFTGYYQHGQLIVDIKSIARTYATSWMLYDLSLIILDFIFVILDYFLPSVFGVADWSRSLLMLRILRLVRIMRAIKLRRGFAAFQDLLHSPAQHSGYSAHGSTLCRDMNHPKVPKAILFCVALSFDIRQPVSTLASWSI